MAKLDILDLELRVLAHMTRSLKAVARVMEMGITPDHFEYVQEGPGKRYTRNIFIWVYNYYQQSGTLYPHSVFENKLIEVAASTDGAVHAQNLELLWGDMEEKEINDDELYDLLERLKQRYATKAYAEAIKMAHEKSTNPTVGFKDAIIGLKSDLDVILREMEGGSAGVMQSLDMTNCAEEFKEDYEKRRDHPELYQGIPMGLEQIDNSVHGMSAGKIYLLLAMSSGGKSIVMMNIANHAHSVSKKNVIYFSFEMDAKQCMYRHISMWMDEHYGNMMGALTHEERVEEIYEKLKSMEGAEGPYFKYETSLKLATPSFIEAKILEITQQYGKPDLVVVDYMGNMSGDNSRKNSPPWERNGDAVQPLLDIAMRWSVPILTAQQFTKGTITETRKARMENKPMQLWQDASAGDSRLMYSTHIGIAIDSNKEKKKITFFPVKMREGEFEPFGVIVHPQFNKIEAMTPEDQQAWKTECGLMADPNAPAGSELSSNPKTIRQQDGSAIVEHSGGKKPILKNSLIFSLDTFSGIAPDEDTSVFAQKRPDANLTYNLDDWDKNSTQSKAEDLEISLETDSEQDASEE